jgi:hypothetical protein
MIVIRKSALAAAGAATLLSSAMPLAAADISVPVSARVGDSPVLGQSAEYHRGYRRHRRLDVDAGDVIIGIGLIAAIAAIADSADGNKHRDREESRYDDRRDDRTDYQGNDLGAAVSLCSDAAERSAGNGARVREIASVTSEGNGWRVQGELDGVDARNFDCSAVNGRVDYVRLDDRNT